MDISSIKKRIKASQQKSAYKQDVKILAVTKNQKAETVNQLDLQAIGENKVQEAVKKFPLLSKKFEKHLIGHLQSNKVKKALEIFDVIQSVDSLKLATKISNAAQKEIQIMLQVNISKDPSKYGFLANEIENIIYQIKKLPNIKLIGLMTIGAQDSLEERRAYFRKFKKLFDQISKKTPLQYLSMGMSEDFEIAIEEGSNMVRLGRILFE